MADVEIEFENRDMEISRIGYSEDRGATESERFLSKLILAQPGFIYRGQSDKGWGLKPSIFRIRERLSSVDATELERREAQAWTDFIDHAGALNPKIADLDWLDAQFVMQHYGAPTRLLDWTLSPFVALYFACRDWYENPNPPDAMLWSAYAMALRAPHCPSTWGEIDPVRILDSDAAPLTSLINENWRVALLEVCRDLKTRREKWPMVVRPTRYDERLVAQRAAFTFHGDATDDPKDWPLPELEWRAGKWSKREITTVPPRLKISKVVVPGRWKGGLLAILADMNITEASLFPGTDGLGRTVRHTLLTGRARLNPVYVTKETNAPKRP